MGYKLAMFLGLVGLLMVLLVDPADSECCYAFKICDELKTWLGTKKGNCRRYCFDGRLADYYCGKGSCNIFGCNCKGGCRGRQLPNGILPPILELEGEDAMPSRGFEDHNADEELERVAEEARSLLELLHGEQETIYREESARPGREFGHHDSDQDMKLSKKEALEMLKKMEYVDISNLPDDWFESMDKNNDGYIDPEEYDEDMAKDLE